ncbi:hypothetical protein M0812_28301 [Anaeramoeba flamelloides]|uniref:Uncharacterized protein n=1 Tax=Anaeramoeba flamelloides TaxID=1746091 RepID=A0AAV7YAD2_9EUKA|nr:hypothetical protein M0812_28301 [Anaeramoeba flamelloides]
MTNSSSLYLTGLRGNFSFLTQEKNNNLPKWTKSSIKKTQTIKKLVYIISSGLTSLILTESGKVWSLANRNRFKEVPLLDADQSTFEKIRPVTFFEEKKLFVNSIAMGYGSCYYLCNGDQLYASGSNADGRLGTVKKKREEPMPVSAQDKVTKIFTGIHASGFFFVTSKPDRLYACGRNQDGELGIDHNSLHRWVPAAVKNFKGSEILTVSSGRSHSVLITNEGQTYSCGRQIANGYVARKKFFTLIPQLKEKKAVQLATGSTQTLVLTDQNELYGWGFDKNLYPIDEFIT